ncbi:hypothetical protein SDJN03_05058, partial [Cucurbita argyrosperma subsp. sororia]
MFLPRTKPHFRTSETCTSGVRSKITMELRILSSEIPSTSSSSVTDSTDLSALRLGRENLSRVMVLICMSRLH